MLEEHASQDTMIELVRLLFLVKEQQESAEEFARNARLDARWDVIVARGEAEDNGPRRSPGATW